MASYVRVAVGIIVLKFILFCGTLATRIKEETKYRLLILQGLIFAQLLTFLCARYSWRYLYGPTSDPSASSNSKFGKASVKLLFVPLAFVLGTAQFAIISGYVLPSTDPHWFVVLSFTCFGIMLITATLVFISQVLDSILALCSLRAGRHFFFPTGFKSICLLFLIAVCTISALLNAAKPPVVISFQIPVPYLPACFKGLSILLLSDLHIGPTVGKTKVEFIVKLSNKLKPDVVLFSGDLLDAPLQVKEAVKPLAKLNAKHGTFFVAGNHDFYTGYINEWMKELQSLNITILQNKYVPLVSEHPSCLNETIYLSGVFDKEGGILRSPEYGEKVSAALNGRQPGIPTILMTHRPSAGKAAIHQFKDIALVLCGHTHGGQILPISLWHYVMEPYFSGLYKINVGQSSSYLYVSSGVFYWGMPMRQFSRSEIALFTLE